MNKLKKIYVEITNNCNLKCEFCKPCSRLPEFITPENFELILQKISPHTSNVYLHVLGEPLLHPQLPILLDLCEQYGISASITTNGTLVGVNGKSIANKPAIRQINYSLHSLEPFDNWKDTVNSINEFIKKTSHIYHCFRLWNISDKSNILLQKKQTGGFNNEIMDYLSTLGYSINKNIALTAGNGVTIGQNVFLQVDNRFVWPKIGGDEKNLIGKCLALKTHVGILVDGSVVPCCLDCDGAITLGNIYTQPLQKILDCTRAVAIKTNFANNKIVEPYCRTCGFINKFTASI